MQGPLPVVRSRRRAPPWSPGELPGRHDNQYGQGRELVRTATDYVTEITFGSSTLLFPGVRVSGWRVVPREPTDVAASSRSHSPTGSRGRVTVRSTLMNMKSVDGRAAPTPLPESATNRVRDIGEASSPGSNGIRGRVHAARTRDCVGPAPCPAGGGLPGVNRHSIDPR